MSDILTWSPFAWSMYVRWQVGDEAPGFNPAEAEVCLPPRHIDEAASGHEVLRSRIRGAASDVAVGMRDDDFLAGRKGQVQGVHRDVGCPVVRTVDLFVDDEVEDPRHRYDLVRCGPDDDVLARRAELDEFAQT